MVAASDTHTGLIVSGGLLYLCGSNSYGELAFPVGPLPASRDRLPRESREKTPIAWSSRFLLVAALQQHKVKVVALGRHFSMALTRTGRVFSWGLNDLNQLGLNEDTILPLSPSLGDDAPPPLPHTPDPQPLWLPPGGPSESQLLFYLISAGAFNACAAAVELPPGGADAAAAGEALDGLFRRVLCRSRSSVGWEHRKLTAAQPPAAATPAAAAAAPAAAAAAGGGGGSPHSNLNLFTSSASSKPLVDNGGLQRLLTLSRGESGGVGYDMFVDQPTGSPPSAVAGGAGAGGGGGRGVLVRQDSSSQDVASFFLAGVSIEEVLRLLEGARSTGNLIHLKLMASQVLSDVFRLNSSFAYPGHGSVPDFEGLHAVYQQLPAEVLPLVCHGFSCVINATMKSTQHLKRPDQIKFILFILSCTPLFMGFCGEEEEKKQTGHSKGGGASDHVEERERTSPGRNPPAPADTPADTPAAAAAAASEAVSAAAKQQQQRGEMLYTALIHMVFHLPPEGKRSFLRLVKEFPDTIFEKALVRTACRYLARAVEEAGGHYRIADRVWHCAALLQLLYRANASSNRQQILVCDYSIWKEMLSTAASCNHPGASSWRI
ncbi:hypothetical protein ACSSS7_003779 [Eimeria intestinalis]